MTSEADRAALVHVAREAIRAHVSHTSMPPIPQTGAAARRGAAFVTLHRAGALRGCIGHLHTDAPLGQVVAECAVAAASEDPRFPPVSSDEAPSLDVEISLLGPLEPVRSLDEIAIGKHGLVVESGWHRGLLLPQVATEWKWDAKTFVEQTCQKAGLPRDAWSSGAAKLFKFEAEVFS
jgi:AmmeMemoRadiSam system protein A